MQPALAERGAKHHAGGARVLMLEAEGAAPVPRCPFAQVPTAVSKSEGATLLTHDLFTNNVLYLEAALDMRGVPAALLPLVPLFCRSLTNMATEVRGV